MARRRSPPSPPAPSPARRCRRRRSAGSSAAAGGTIRRSCGRCATALAAPVDPVDAVGWNGDALEAQCFGFLAARVRAACRSPFRGPPARRARSPAAGWWHPTARAGRDRLAPCSSAFPTRARDGAGWCRGRAIERIRRLGLTRNPFEDLYHKALEIPWWAFLAATSATYLGGNVVFAALYLLQPGAIDKARPGSLADAFFFSVQTMATIGYGQMAPATAFANSVVTLETLFGMILLAVVTGLFFTRFSRPTARVLFSNVAVVAPFNGQMMLMLRMGNQRSNQILQAEVSLAVLRDEVTAEGIFMRRFHDLALVRRAHTRLRAHLPRHAPARRSGVRWPGCRMTI